MQNRQKKSIWQNASFHYKNTQQTRNKKELSQPDKRTSMKNPQLITYWMVKRLDAFPLKLRTRQGSLLLSLLLSIVLKISARAIVQEKERKSIQIGKGEIKLSLFTNDMILYLESPTNTWVQQDCRIKIKIQRSIVCLYICNDQSKKFKKQFPSQQHQKGYLGMNLTKEV